MILLRSALFNALFFLTTALIALVGLPLLAGPRRWTITLARVWARAVLALLRGICGVRVEWRGLDRIPPGPVVVASKHQSAFDTIVWLTVLPDPAYVLKKELLAIPLYGWFARKQGNIPVDRAGGGGALRSMLRAARLALDEGRQIVIFPEGTRSAPGQRVPYQPGVVAIAQASPAPVFPVATDSGRVWGRRAFHKRPGTIRISVLPALPPGLSRAALLVRLEETIETETARLLAEEPVDNSVG
jgi:1-acyl-sn-glycerol-3-phosphate acyltransferase